MTYNFNKTLHSAKGHKIEIDDKAFYGCWEYPDGSEGGGLWFEHDLDGKLILCDYDGVFELPKSVEDALRADGYTIEDCDASCPI